MESNPFSSPSARVADVPQGPRHDITWPKTMAVWWSFIWRSAVYGAIGGFILGAIAGGVAGATGHLDKARVAGMLAGYIAGLVGSVFALKQALQKHQEGLISAAQLSR